MKGICPRCGVKINWIERRRVGDSIYYYAVHETKIEGKRHIRKCYLGPETYEYVSRTHAREGLVLRGLLDSDRVLDYLDAIIAYLEANPLEPQVARHLAVKFKLLAERLEKFGAETQG